MLVFGINGSGKSTFSKKKIEKYCSSRFSNDQIVVVDPHGEYREIAEQYNGKIISFHDKIPFPSFEVNLNIGSLTSDQLIEEKVNEVVSFCEQMYIRLLDDDVKDIIKEKAFKILKTRDGHFSFRSLYNQLKEIDNDTVQILVKCLQRNYSYDSYLNLDSVQNRFVVYDLSKVPTLLKGAAYTSCLSEIENEMRENCRKHQKTRILLDDFLCLFSHPGSAYVLSDLWNYAKLYNSSFSAICNDVSMLRYTYPGQNILCNTKHVVIFELQPVERSICQELYLLSDKKTSKISSLEFGNNVHVNFAGRIARKTLAFLASESE